MTPALPKLRDQLASGWLKVEKGLVAAIDLGKLERQKASIHSKKKYTPFSITNP